jgi:hypothetical protein
MAMRPPNREHQMSAQGNEVNRDIDAQNAYGHVMKRRSRTIEVEGSSDETKRRSTLDDAEGIDDLAEGHLRART